MESIERDPLDAETLRTIRLKEPLRIHEADGTVRETLELELVHRGPDGRLRGDALYLAINQLSGQTRGWSDLLCVADWLDQLDVLLFTEVERVQYQRAFVWDVQIEAETEEALERRREELAGEGPPRPGTVLAHRKTETWSCISPNLQMQDSVTFIKFVMMICFGGLSMPEHYFAEGGDVNKATSTNAAHLRLGARSQAGGARVHRDGRRAGRGRTGPVRRAGRRAPEHRAWEVVSRDPERTAYDVLGQMLSTLAQALTQAVEAGGVHDDKASRAFRTAASDLGLGDFPVLGDSFEDTVASVQDELKVRWPNLDAAA